MLRPPGLPHLPMNAHLATAHAPGHAGTGAWACEAAAAWSAGAPEVADPEQASCELASVYSPNQLRVLGSPSAFRMRWRRDAMGPMLLSALSFDVEVELQQQASQSFYLVSTQLRGRAQIDAGRVQGGGGAGLVMSTRPRATSSSGSAPTASGCTCAWSATRWRRLCVPSCSARP
jgi:hypothetical protein